MAAGSSGSRLGISPAWNLRPTDGYGLVMGNACFRCKTPIASGGTFCEDCDQVVTPIEGQYTRESRLWVWVAALPLWLLLSIVAVPLLSLVLPAGPVSAVSTLATVLSLPLLFAFMWALVKDAEHVAARDDVDWEPSAWRYVVMSASCLLLVLVPVPFVAGYHLYRRYTTVGLPLGRT